MVEKPIQSSDITYYHAGQKSRMTLCSDKSAGLCSKAFERAFRSRVSALSTIPDATK